MESQMNGVRQSLLLLSRDWAHTWLTSWTMFAESSVMDDAGGFTMLSASAMCPILCVLKTPAASED